MSARAWELRVAGTLAVLGLLAGVTLATAAAAQAAPELVVADHSRSDLKHYDTFTWQTALVTGVTDAAAARIVGTVDSVVQRNLRQAVRAGRDGCFGLESPCGFFASTLSKLNCATGVLCVEYVRGAIYPGAATSSPATTVMVFDPATGARLPITSVVPAARMPAFLKAVAATLKKHQKQEGFYDPFLTPTIRANDLRDWAPLANGIEIWFPKYFAGPGAAGVVSIIVPYA
ncbi:MAG: RsiV family protein [Candidatus Nanopelagicales bacterium]